MTKPPPRPPKKSELLEVRLSHETKQDFLAACRKAGRTASDVVREAIDRFIEADRQRPETQSGKRSLTAMIPTPIRRKRYLAVGLGLTGLAVFAALPSAAGPSLETVFKQLDRNSDGVVTAQEFWGDEITPGVVSETRAAVSADAGAVEPVVSRDSFAVLRPPGSGATGRFSDDADWSVNMMIGLRITQRSRNNDDPRAHEFVGMDTNRDDTISFEEYRVRLHAMLSRGFELLDSDHDSFVTPAEFAFSDDEAILSGRLQPGGQDCPYKECAVKWTQPTDVQAAGFAALDANGDKRVSLLEYLSKT